MNKSGKVQIMKERGITLIALVVTIVILLILAGITINYLLGPDSIFNSAEKAKIEIKKAKYEEALRVIGIGLQPERKINNWQTQEYMNKYEEKIKEESIFKDAKEIKQLPNAEKITIQIITEEGWVYWVTEDKIEYKGTEEDLEPEPPVVVEYTVEWIEKDGEKINETKRQANAGDNVSVTEEDKVLENYDFDESNTNNVLSATLEENVSTTLKLYFTKKVLPTGVYAKLYSEGTLMLSTTDYKDTSKGSYTDYGNIVNNSYTLEQLPAWSGKVKKVVVHDEIIPKDTSYWFANTSATNSLTSIDVSKMNTCIVEKMDGMFRFCTGLTSLDVSNFDTSNVTSMEGMFFYCNKLTSLNLSNFDTSKVTSMRDMFIRCEKLESLDVSNFDTSNVTNMQAMFRSCLNLQSLDVSKFNTSEVTNMSGMFASCEKLTSLDLSSFNTSKVTDINQMFQGCIALAQLRFGEHFDTSNITDMKQMFLRIIKFNKSRFKHV